MGQCYTFYAEIKIILEQCYTFYAEIQIIFGTVLYFLCGDKYYFWDSVILFMRNNILLLGPCYTFYAEIKIILEQCYTFYAEIQIIFGTVNTLAAGYAELATGRTKRFVLNHK